MQVTVQLTARFATPFHVGGGVTGESATLKPLLKDSLGRPYVPGSALKGVARHQAERIVRALQGSEAAVCRSPRAETMCPQRPIFGAFCPVCRAFGSPALPSPFYWCDLCVAQDAIDAQAVQRTSLRSGVGISRYRGAAAEQLLYTTETASMAPYLALHGTIDGTLREQDGRGPLALLLSALNVVHTIGGARSRGLGWLTLEAESAQLPGAQIKEVLEQWLKISA